jgi:hypothetical protein
MIRADLDPEHCIFLEENRPCLYERQELVTKRENALSKENTVLNRVAEPSPELNWSEKQDPEPH